MDLVTTNTALTGTDLRSPARRSRAERASDGVIAGYVHSLTRYAGRPYNPAGGPERADRAGVAELVDAPVLGAGGRKLMGVRVPPPAFRLPSLTRKDRRGWWPASPEPAC